jgi:T5orf172 domain
VPVPRSVATFCRAHLTWDCPLVLLADHDEDDDPRDDGTYDRQTNTVICNACYAVLTARTPSGQGRAQEVDSAAAVLRREGLAVADPIVRRDMRWFGENWTVDNRDDTGLDDTHIPSEPEQRDEFVYFFIVKRRREIKIGQSSDPAERRRNLQAGSSEEIEILHVTRGDRKVESEWHKRFAQLRTGAGREWFKADPALLDAIEQDRQQHPQDTEQLIRIAEERREREDAQRLLREAGHKGPYHPVQMRVATTTCRWRSATRNSRHFVLPWKDRDHIAILAFGELRPLTDDPEAELLRRHANKVPAWTHTLMYPAGELCSVPLEHLTHIRKADFERAAAEQFDRTIPDMIADHVREGLAPTLDHHKLLEWWREGFEFDPDQHPRQPPPWADSAA